MIKRYTQPVITVFREPKFRTEEVPLFEHPKGKWVKWEDARNRIGALEAALREAKPQIYSPHSPTHALIEKLLNSQANR